MNIYKIIVTGTIFEIEDQLMIVAKIIGAETSRVFGASVKGKNSDSIIDLSEQLATKIADSIIHNGQLLVAAPTSKADRIAKLKQMLKSFTKPSLRIEITEHHINRAASDPAAQTEMILYSIESGFEVIADNVSRSQKAQVLITGEGFTEFATRKGELVGVKARLEVKAIDIASGKVIAVDRQTELEVDLSEIIAAKKALEKAAAKIAERILPKVAQARLQH
ncbi:MAG: hypothetical protein methR_P0277 [Methyloprofundus sp.]|nr:MAG: hypothetical protein methR_P0277 [Methyloprofundus sp.]